MGCGAVDDFSCHFRETAYMPIAEAFDSISTSAFNRLGSKFDQKVSQGRQGSEHSTLSIGKGRYHVVHQPGPGVHGVTDFYGMVPKATKLRSL